MNDWWDIKQEQQQHWSETFIECKDTHTREHSTLDATFLGREEFLSKVCEKKLDKTEKEEPEMGDEWRQRWCGVLFSHGDVNK